MNIVFTGELEQLASRRDKTFRLTIGTMDATMFNPSGLLGLLNKEVKVLISDTNISKEQIKAVEETEIAAKKELTMSQKLRFAIERYHGIMKTSGETKEQFYNRHIQFQITKWNDAYEELKEQNQ